MEHHFDVKLAQKYGVIEAILLNHFEFWIQQNEANERNFYNGRYWTYNSLKAFCEIFPYLSEKQIRRALNKLQEEGILLVGNFNQNPYDRTLWYSLSEKGNSILPKGQMETAERADQYQILTQILTQIKKPVDLSNPPSNRSRLIVGNAATA